VVHQLRGDPQLCSVPILILTAKDLTAAEREVLRISVQGIVAKGGGATLLSELRRLLPGVRA
jgi:hypothetical protein